MDRRAALAPRTCGTLASASIVALLAGCGGGQSGGAAFPAPAAASRAGNAVRAPRAAAPLTRGHALAFARAVNLTLADVPEATASPRKPSSFSTAEKREIARCEGPHAGHRELLSARSPKFERGSELETEYIYSDVTVQASAGESARNLAELASAAARRCLARVLSRAFASRPPKGGGHYGRFAAYRLLVSAPGSNAVAGVRLATTLLFPGPEVTVPVYVDVIAFARGPAEVALITASATQPVPANTEQQLLSLLRARAMAQQL